MAKKKVEKVEKEVTTKKEEKKLRPLDNFEDDFIEYAVNRLSLEDGDEKELTKDSIYHALHLLWQFDSSDTGYKYLIGFLSNVYDFYAEFEAKWGNSYDTACECCRAKIDAGEIPEPTKTNNNCGDC